MARLLILGAGGYGRTVAQAAAGMFEEIAFLDDQAAAALGPCVDYEKWKGIYQYAYPAFGSNELRKKWLDVLEQAGFSLPVIVHPRAWVSPSAVMEPGSVVLAMACVGADSRVCRGAIINMGALIDHDCVVGACVHAAPGAVVKAGNHLEPGEKVESGEVRERKEYVACKPKIND